MTAKYEKAYHRVLGLENRRWYQKILHRAEPTPSAPDATPIAAKVAA
jgi:hypothetical protein